MKNYNKIIKLIQNDDLKVDGIIIGNKKDILFEYYFNTFNEKKLHRGYSITKTLTMLGIGYLVTTKKINVDDKITNYFSEFDVNHKWINEMTIKNLLSMQTAYKSTTYKRSGDDYLKSFFTTKPEKKPGDKFAYDTSASYTLAALVEKVSGMKLITLLKQKVFTTNQLSDTAYIEDSYENISLGGSGMFTTLRDLYTVGQALLTNGFGNIDSDFMRDALSPHADTSNFSGGIDFKQGYGYQIWMNRFGGFTCYGMYGQLVFYHPQSELLLVTHANLVNERPETQKIIDNFIKLLEGDLND